MGGTVKLRILQSPAVTVAKLLKADASLKKVERFEFDCSLGIVPIDGGKFLVARGTSTKEKGHTLLLRTRRVRR